jgi:anti-anti-sigma regulatory factor
MFPNPSTAGGLRVTLYVASGNFTHERCARLAETIERLAGQGWIRWVLDFSSVRHMDYRGLKRLLESATALELAGGAFGWCGLSAYMRDIACVSGAHDRPCYRNRREAMSLVGAVPAPMQRAGEA